MSDIIINTGGTSFDKVTYDSIAAGNVLSLNLSGVASAAAEYSTVSGGAEVLSGDMDQLHLKTNVANAFSISGVRFKQAGIDHIVKASGQVQINPSPVTGNGTAVGTMSAGLGEVVLDDWAAGGAPDVTDWRGVAGAPVNGSSTPFATYATTFRIPTAPIKTNSFSVLGTMQDGTTFNYSADGNGYIDEDRVKGRIDYLNGVVTLIGVTQVAPAGQSQVDLTDILDIPGVGLQYIDLIRQESLRYNAVAYTYLPMDATLLGINPVRLPSDGRVPIYKAGGAVVVGNKKTTTPATVSNGQTISVARTRLSRVQVFGNNDAELFTGWTADLEAGTVTFSDVTGYSQPVRITHRVEDMSQLRDAQIDGTLTLLRALTHNYEAGESYVSSAVVTQDLFARVSLLFDQESWDLTSYSDTRVGDAALGTYNDTDYPIVLTNAGALTEKWVIRFTSSTAFQVIGENVGQITVGSTGVECAPINPRNGEPYFVIPILGWGAGWATGNILRFNTVGAQKPIWLVRTVQQGPEAGENYTFELLARGDIDNPI